MQKIPLSTYILNWVSQKFKISPLALLITTTAFTLSNAAFAATPVTTPPSKSAPAQTNTQTTAPTPTADPAATAPLLQPSVINKMKALLNQGNAEAAYALGKQAPDELGNPEFDFYFGVAALDSGHAAEGVLALERYTLNFPANANARLELARGYFILGEDGRAREEFNAVLKTNPPALVQTNIARFMDAIRARESRYKTTAGAFAEVGLGYDSNINGGVDNAEILLPVFGQTTLTSGVKTDDSFSHVAMGGQVTHPFAPGISLFGGANVDTRLYFKEDTFNQLNMAVTGGATFLQAKNLFRGSLTYATTNVDSEKLRDVIGAGGEWNYQLDELQAMNVSAQYAQLAYAKTNQVRDANYMALTGGYRRAFIGSWQPLFQGSLTLAQEKNDSPLGVVRDDLSRDIYGIRVGASVSPASKWSLNSNISYQDSAFKDVDILLIKRKDQYLTFDAALGYAYTKNLMLRTELLVASNASNNPLNEYKRNSLTVKARYEFK